MKLINLIRALLSCFTTPAQAANAAMPNDNSITSITIASGHDVTEYFAPFDGYAVLKASTIQDGNIGLGIYSGSEQYGAVITNISSASHVNMLIKPVAKGASVHYYVYRNNLTNISMMFVKAIGGGYKRFIFNALQRFGGGLCLSYLATSAHFATQRLQRLFTATRLFTLVMLPIQLLLSNGRMSLLRLMGGCKLELKTLSVSQGLTCNQSAVQTHTFSQQTSRLLMMRGVRLVCRLKKAKALGFLSTVVGQIKRLHYSQAKVQPSLCQEGGAL